MNNTNAREDHIRLCPRCMEAIMSRGEKIDDFGSCTSATNMPTMTRKKTAC